MAATKTRTKVTTEPTPQKLTKAERSKQLKAFARLCFAAMGDRKIAEIAKLTRLSTTTLYKMRKGKLSVDSHFNTIQSLGLVAGFQLKWTRTSARIILLD